MLVRKNDWFPLLQKFLEENRQRPFRWGSWDCCLFACNGIREITGVDVAAKYRGQYRSMLGAMRLIGGPITKVVFEVAASYGIAKHMQLEDGRPGDVVVANIGTMDTLGIISPMRTLCFVTTTGLVTYPVSIAREAWKIG